MMDKASAKDLESLNESAATVFGQIIAGDDPTGAVVKTAKAASYTKPWASRLCEITNRLLAVQRIEEGGEKSASDYPVVDTKEVLDTLFRTGPTPVEKASSVGLIQPGRQWRYSDIQMGTTKQASVNTQPVVNRLPDFGDEQSLLNHASALCTTLKSAAGAVREHKADAEYTLTPLCKMAASAIADSGIRAADIEERAVAYFGKDAHAVMGAIAGFARGDFDRFEGEPRVFTTNPWNKEPFSNVKEAVIAFRQNAYMLGIHEKVAKIVSKAEAQLRQGIKDAGVRLREEKEAAGILPYLVAKDTAKRLTPEGSTQMDLNTAGLTPEEVSFYGSVRARQALVGALKDPVIARRDLNDVVRTYNRILDSAPWTAQDEPALTAALRLALEQDMGGTDIKLNQDVEKGLAQRADVTSMA